MQIKNKRTHKEYHVTQEEWAIIIANPLLRNKFQVIDITDIKEAIIGRKKDEKTIIIPQEIINFKNQRKTKKKKE